MVAQKTEGREGKIKIEFSVLGKFCAFKLEKANENLIGRDGCIVRRSVPTVSE